LATPISAGGKVEGISAVSQADRLSDWAEKMQGFALTMWVCERRRNAARTVEGRIMVREEECR
jgi:hypothetical protein